MVSRRKILSRSRDDLNLAHHHDDDDHNGGGGGGHVGFALRDEEDIWYQKERLYRDHIQEVLNKWESIDDEIWAKVIVLERNRRVAKAYARAPVLTVNGSNDGFDGFRIGVNGFENPMRDARTEELKQQIGQGCKIKMDETGNILIKRFSKAPVYVKNTIEENAVSNDVIKLPGGLLELEKPFKLFDMKKFQQNVNRELKRTYPDRRKIECQCISTVAFARSEPDLLDSPIWIMLVNVVALEMLKAKMPDAGAKPGASRGGAKAGKSAANGGPGSSATLNPPTSSRPGVRHSSEPRKRFLPASGSSDEDPYSLTPSGSSGSSGKGNGGQGHNRDSGGDSGNVSGGSGGDRDRGNNGNGRLPSREKEYYGPQNWAKDYSDEVESPSSGGAATTTTLKKKHASGGGQSGSRSRPTRRAAEEKIMMRKQQQQQAAAAANNSSSGDDPYYCGLRARVPNFTKQQHQQQQQSSNIRESGLRSSSSSKQLNGGSGNLRSPPPSRSVPNLQNLAQLPGAAPPFWWHSRLYQDQPQMVAAPAEMASYHYPGRMAPAGGRGGYRTALLGGPHSNYPPGPSQYQAQRQPPQRQAAVFRTGWE